MCETVQTHTHTVDAPPGVTHTHTHTHTHTRVVPPLTGNLCLHGALIRPLPPHFSTPLSLSLPPSVLPVVFLSQSSSRAYLSCSPPLSSALSAPPTPFFSSSSSLPFFFFNFPFFPHFSPVSSHSVAAETHPHHSLWKDVQIYISCICSDTKSWIICSSFCFVSLWLTLKSLESLAGLKKNTWYLKFFRWRLMDFSGR